MKKSTEILIKSQISKLNQVTDKLGKPLDEKIIKTVAVLNLLNFKTYGSCEGHISHGCASPWIDVEVPVDKTKKEKLFKKQERIDKIVETKGFTDQAFALQKEFNEEIEKLSVPMRKGSYALIKLLDEFYKKHKTSAMSRIIIVPRRWSFRIEIQAEIFQQIVSKDERKRNLAKYQAEMNKFTDFLTHKL